jgi:hypothetical protein
MNFIYGYTTRMNIPKKSDLNVVELRKNNYE